MQTIVCCSRTKGQNIETSLFLLFCPFNVHDMTGINFLCDFSLPLVFQHLTSSVDTYEPAHWAVPSGQFVLELQPFLSDWTNVWQTSSQFSDYLWRKTSEKSLRGWTISSDFALRANVGLNLQEKHKPPLYLWLVWDNWSFSLFILMSLHHSSTSFPLLEYHPFFLYPLRYITFPS